MPKVSFNDAKRWTDVEQNEDEWLDMRIGKVGGSSIGKIMANFGKAFGPPAHDVALKIALESITGTRLDQDFNSPHLERGHEQEPVARTLYEDTTFTKVTNGGFFECGDLIGVSPDGCVNEGLIEIKCVIYKVHFATLKRGSFDPTYKFQMLMEMGASGRPWVDYAQYCSEFPENKRLFIDRLYAEDYKDDMKNIEDRLNQFVELVEEKKRFIEAL